LLHHDEIESTPIALTTHEAGGILSRRLRKGHNLARSAKAATGA
jgi:hypothetical protein